LETTPYIDSPISPLTGLIKLELVIIRAYGSRPSEVILVSRSPGFPESRSPELHWLPGVPVSGVTAKPYIPQHDRHFVGLSFTEARALRRQGLRSYGSPELVTEARPPEFGSGFPESRSPELYNTEISSRGEPSAPFCVGIGISLGVVLRWTSLVVDIIL